MPTALQQQTIDWYHTTLCHPGENRTEETIRQHFYWKGMRDQVLKSCGKCIQCQFTKKKTIKYGKLPPKTAEADPWEVVCVDLIGPYLIPQKGTKERLQLHCLTMIDPATSWFEIVAIESKEALEVANAAELTWFTRYPWPNQIIFDRGSEFMGEFTKMASRDYGLKTKPITARNPQANAIVERVHQTVHDMVRTILRSQKPKGAQ